MKRRDFIRNASLAGAGGLIAGGLPAWASASTVPGRHVVLAVVAGISREDFVQLFPKKHAGSLGNAGHLITDMRYNGEAAGHRLALESILQGRYIPEKQSGQTALTETALFAEKIPGRKFFVGADREFLNPRHISTGENATQLCVQITQPAGSKYPRARLKNVNIPKQGFVAPYQGQLNRQRPEHDFFPTVTEDGFISDTVCHILSFDAPAVAVAHFMDADMAHFDVDLVKKKQEETCWALQHLWHRVCNHPLMENTLFVAVSDFGRNGTPNRIQNARGLFGTDHSVTDENTRQIACLLASPAGLPPTIAGSGESIDILPTLLHFLGTGIPADLPGKSLL